MSDSKSSGNLGVADIITFISILVLGVLVFFGMNFMTLGDKVPSIIVAILTVVLMTVFVFLAAFAKAQDRNQDTWKKIEYVMLGLYVLVLVPSYFFSAKFFDIQFDKENIKQQVQADTDDLNKMFADYNRKSESRANAYQIDLEALLKSNEGKKQIADMLELSDISTVNLESVNQIVASFSKQLKGRDFQTLESEKNELVKSSDLNFNNWNILLIPQYASELGTAKVRFASELERIYEKNQNKLESNIPEFDTTPYLNESGIIDTFKSTDRFSILGLIAVLFLGALGLVKYILGPKSAVVQMKAGDASIILEDGGLTL